MDSLQSIRVFCQVVRLGSFTAAAESLNMSTAMASKHIGRLEQRLQVKLLNRTSRKLSLTEAGSHYYQQCVEALNTLDNAELEIQQGSLTPRGTLKITVPLICGTPYFVRLLAKFQQLYPEIHLSVYFENKHSNLVAEGFDLAIRAARTLEPNLIAKPLTRVKFRYVASPSYLLRNGMPKDLDDLHTHYGITANYTDTETPFRVIADSNDTLMTREMAIAGMGIAILPDWLTQDYLSSGELVDVLPNSPPDLNPTIYIVYTSRKYLTAKVRTFIDFMVENTQSKKPL